VSYEQILYEVQGGVALVTLNRPEKLNAMTALMQAELEDAMAEADGDESLRAVVVTGAGRGFCAGADMGGGESFGSGWGEIPSDLRKMMPMDVRKPVIAAINGPAVGIGLTWPLQADVRYVAQDAKLAFAFVRRGVLPELASHVILPRLAGLAKASELLLSGRMFLGSEAVEYGVATRALPKEEVLPAAMELARDIATNAAPLPVAISKRLIWEGVGIDLERFRAREDRLFAFTTAHADSTEGTASFFERRDPMWSGSLAREFPEWPD
jgi:enoyl-CoA hydratase/carnithine racemase